MKNNTSQTNTYETDELVSQYLEFHYGAEYFDVKNFPKACIDTIFAHTKGQRVLERALDLGCAVGRSSFELALNIDHIDAIDYSAGFIQQAKSLAENGNISYAITDEGELTIEKNVTLQQLGLQMTAKRVRFFQGDANDLDASLTSYDLIFAGNLIDRLTEPKTFLNTIHERLNHDGLLVLTSPYTWLEAFTPKKNWVGGYQKNGKRVTTLDGLKLALDKHFETFVEPVDIPFVIRETARKHQHTIAQMTFWRKKA